MNDIILLADSLESIVRMPDADAGILIKALATGNTDNLSDIASLVYPLIKGQVDRMIALRDKRSAAGRLGGSKPKQFESKTEANQKQIKAPVPVPVPVPEPIKNKRFTPPTADEVRAYAQENALNIDANRFVDYYTAVGWKVSGKSPMKDWKAAVRNWAARDKKAPTTDYKSRIMSVDYADLLRRKR